MVIRYLKPHLKSGELSPNKHTGALSAWSRLPIPQPMGQSGGAMGGPNILVVGHSHIGPLRNAAVIRREADPGRPRTRTIYLPDPVFGGEMQGDEFSPGVRAAIIDQLARHSPVVASAIGGNAHSMLALIPYRPFDFILTGDDALPIEPGVEIRSEQDVRAELAGMMTQQLLQMRLLAEIAGPFFHLESPPPVRNSEWVRAHAERFFTSQPAFAELGVAPPGVRYRTWRLACRIVREECDKLGCHYVAVPKIMCGEAGMLRPSQARDATHAGTHFGETMLRALEQAAADR